MAVSGETNQKLGAEPVKADEIEKRSTWAQDAENRRKQGGTRIWEFSQTSEYNAELIEVRLVTWTVKAVAIVAVDCEQGEERDKEGTELVELCATQ